MSRESPTAPWTAGLARVRRIPGRSRPGHVYYWRAVVREDDAEIVVWAGWCKRADPDVTREILAAALREKRQEQPAPTMRDLLGKFRGDCERRGRENEIRPRSVEVYRGQIKYLDKGLGAVLLEQLDHAEIESYVRARRTKASTRTVALELMTLGAAWTWGRKRGLAPDRPLDMPTIAVKPTREKLTPNRGEVLAVLERLRGWTRRAVAFLASTGCRLGEFADLRWSSVDLQRLEVCVAGKTGPRTIPISVDLARELGTPGAADAFVSGVSPATVRTRLLDHLATACAAAKVPRITPHGLRRYAVDALYEAGVDVGVVAAALGQSPTVALRDYRRARPEAVRRGLEAAGLGKIPEGQIVMFPVQRNGTTDENGG